MWSGGDPALLTAPVSGGAWTWAGLRIDAALDLSDMSAYQGNDETSQRRTALSEQVSYLAALLGSSPRTSVEMRWIRDPADNFLHGYLLARCYGQTPTQADHAVADVLTRLGTTPPHVRISALAAAELSAALNPFPIHAGGAVDVRKRTLTAIPQRPDARVRQYLMVQPFIGTTSTWEGFYELLGNQTAPVMFTVGLEVTGLSPQFRDMVDAAASFYRRLGEPGEYQSGALYGRQHKLAPDAFAADASNLYADASRRYRDRAFRIRVSCASPHPLTDGIPNAVGAMIAKDDAQTTRNYLDSRTVGGAFTLVRPSAAALPAFTSNVNGLNHLDWGMEPIWATGEAPAQLRPLQWCVDAEEANAVFRLPLAFHGTFGPVPVASRPPAVVSAYSTDRPRIVLGRQGTTCDDPELAVPVADLTGHALFLGTTGSGKTNSTLQLTRALWADHHIPFTVIEPVNSDRDDYRWLATLPEFDDLLVITVGDEEVAPFRLNPFQVPAGVRIATHRANLLASFDAAFGLWDPLPSIYRKALYNTYVRVGINPEGKAEDGTAWPQLSDFVAAITEITDNMDYAGDVRSNILAASRVRAESLAEGPCASTLSGPTSYPIGELLERPVILELSAVGDDPKEQSLIMALVLAAMTEHFKAHRVGDHLQHVTVIEEAHRLLGVPAPQGENREGNAQAIAAARMANSLAENRKYGEGIVIVEQDPSKLIPDSYKNTNLKVMHRLPSEQDRQLIGDTMRFTQEQRRYASALPKMSAFCFHASLDRPALVRVPDVRALDAADRGCDRAPLATTEQLSERFHAWVADRDDLRAALEPLGICGECPTRCWLERPAMQAAVPLADEFRAHIDTLTVFTDDWWAKLDRIAGRACKPANHIPDGHWSAAVVGALLTSVYSGPHVRAWLRHYRQNCLQTVHAN